MTHTQDRLAQQQQGRQPDKWLPVLYFSFAHLCLAAALALAFWDPRGIAGFFYHPQLIALVHLVTLGWISGSILGAIYMISPMALRTPMPVGRVDSIAFWLFAVGTIGMVTHFWIDETWGMVSAGLCVWLVFVWVAVRFVPRLARSPVPVEVRLHFYLAFVNIVLAGLLGLAMGSDKRIDILSGFSLDHVVAHAHLAAIGWATMMVMAAGYRLIPMILPAVLPTGRWVWLSAIVTEIGVLGLVVSLYQGSERAWMFGVLVAVGLGVFLSRIVWMLRNRRSPPKALKRPDFGVLHVFLALIALLCATLVGLALLVMPPGEWKTKGAIVYGCLGLIGFLAQMIVGVASRLLPLYGWIRAFADSDFQRQPPSPHVTPWRSLQISIFLLWLTGVPMLTFGLADTRVGLLRAGAGALLVAVAAGLVQQVNILRARRSTPVMRSV